MAWSDFLPTPSLCCLDEDNDPTAIRWSETGYSLWHGYGLSGSPKGSCAGCLVLSVVVLR
jgi:hypothetical protein